MRGMFKILFSFLILSTLMPNAKAQGGGGFDWDKVVYGGSIYPMFSNLGTTIQAMPFVGYKVTDRVVPGIMASYQYTRFNNYPGQGLTTIYNLLGVGPFVRYSVVNGFFVQGEYEFLNGKLEIRPLGKTSFGENNLLLGAGYASPNGFFGQVMFIPTWRGDNSVYPTPLVYRVGFSIF